MSPHRFGSPADSSSSEEEEEVDAIISQALDHVALEQIAALNTSHLPPSSPLPPHLSSRFRHLKSLPQPHPSPPPPPPHATPNAPRSPPVTPPHHNSSTTPAPSQPRDPKPRAASPSPTPPRQRRGCCFCFSPRGGRKDGSGKARTEERRWGMEGEELLEELRGFSSSTREQRSRMKEVMREVEKASREAGKLAELVEQVSARMDFAAGLGELMFSDEEEESSK